MLCVVLIWTLSTCVVTALSSYYMDEICGEHLSLNTERTKSLSLKLTSAEEYNANMNCYVTVTSDAGSQIMASFVWVDINSFLHCPGDYVQISDTQDFNGQRLFEVADTSPSRICGIQKPDAVMTSRSNNVTVRFVSDGAFFGKGFHVVLTQFHEGPCGDAEFGCDNGRCVHSELECDDQRLDHCGDFSDHCRLSLSVVVCIVLAVVVFIIVVFVVSVVVWYRVQSAKDDDRDDEMCDDDDWTVMDNSGCVVADAESAASYILPSVSQLLASSASTARANGSSESPRAAPGTPACLTPTRTRLPDLPDPAHLTLPDPACLTLPDPACLIYLTPPCLTYLTPPA